MSASAKKDEIRLGLMISDFECTPEDITRLLELEPTRSSALRTKTRVPTWRKDSPVDKVGSTVEAQWRGLQPLLLPLTARLKTLPANVYLYLRVTSYDYHSGAYFSPDLIAFAAEINAALDIDLYCLEEP